MIKKYTVNDERSNASKHSKIARKTILLHRGLTGRVIAKRLNCSESLISQIIGGTKRSQRIESQIAQMVGVSRSSLWD